MSHKPQLTWLAAVMLLGVMSSSLVFYGLGDSSLQNHDEARYARIARQITTSNEWMSPTHDGVPYFKKAPLQLWLMAAAYEMLGVNEFSTRLWSALFAVGTVLAVAILGAPLVGRGGAWLAALVLLTSTQYLYNHSARTGEFETAFMFFCTCGWLLLSRDLHRYSVVLLSCAAFSIAGMTKHIAYLAPVVAGALGFLILSGQWRSLTRTHIVLGVAISALILVPWHLCQFVRYGEEFTGVYLAAEVLARAQNGLDSVRGGPFFYWNVMFHGLFPWSVVGVAAVLSLIWADRNGFTRQGGALLGCWICAWLLFIFASTGKHNWYVLPIYPALALVVGHYLATLGTDSRKRIPQLLFVAACLVAVLFSSQALVKNPFSDRAIDGVIQAVPRTWPLMVLREDGPVGVVMLLVMGVCGLVVWDLAFRRRVAGRANNMAVSALIAVVLGGASANAMAPLWHLPYRGCVPKMFEWMARHRTARTNVMLVEPDEIERFYGERLTPGFASLWMQAALHEIGDGRCAKCEGATTFFLVKEAALEAMAPGDRRLEQARPEILARCEKYAVVGKEE